ncbi:MAG: molybdopterin-dependent oxidoreductase [Wenzhouxiangella sp.]|jgi:anaerobic selenocysteine-containing dehydrogenase|nr:molybdopterin-dependent oxidoreductase [Wenzhouxiangella sp.]
MTTIEQTGMKRRTFLGGATAASIGAVLASKGWADASKFFTNTEVDFEGLKQAGYEVRHTLCFQCSAKCGLTGLVKTDAPADGKNFVIFGNQNPDHPQRGMCGRGASAPQTWNSPLRLKKPLKLVGERGSGQFQEISWGQAFDEIAAKMQTIIDESGAEALAFVRHSLGDQASWFQALGTPNLIGQASSCNTAGVVARKWVVGSDNNHHAKLDPDYDNARFVLLPGRTLAAPAGIQQRLARMRAKGGEVAYLNPAHPAAAFGGSEWISCKPATDAAFMLGLANILVNENRYDEDFVRRYTNLPYLIKADGQPLSQADLEEGGDENLFKVSDGTAIVDHNQEGLLPVLSFTGNVTLADGSEIQVRSAWDLYVEYLADYTPQRVANITEVPVETIVRIARKLHSMQGVVEDTWYNTRNGNDTDAVMALLAVNGLLGNFDKPGGLCIRPSTGLPGASLGKGEGTLKTRHGFEYPVPSPSAKRVDKVMYPETNATFHAVVDCVLGQNNAPYPIRALWNVDATIFHRDSNTKMMEDMLRKLDLVVTTDILHQEICDWSDYVLPSDMFLERRNLSNVSWAHTPTVAIQEAVTAPPPDADVRPMEWIAFEVIRRIYPDRAVGLGYDERFHNNPKLFQDEYLQGIEDKRIAGLADKWGRNPVELKEELEREGFVTFKDHVYGVVPYKKPFNTMTQKLEVYSFHVVRKGYRPHGFARHIDPPAFTVPQGGREFYFINGKSPSGSSGVTGLNFSSQFLADPSIWINPADAKRLEIRDGDEVEIEGIDTGWVATATMKVTPRIHPGTLFTYSYSGGNRQKILQELDGFEGLTKGVNPHWFTTGWIDPHTGSAFNNASVRIRRVV